MIKADYDRRADVLYLSKGEPRPAITEPGEDGLMLRFAVEDEKPCGVTVLGYRRLWAEHRVRLICYVSKFLQVNQSDTEKAINSALN